MIDCELGDIASGHVDLTLDTMIMRCRPLIEITYYSCRTNATAVLSL